MRIAIKDLRGVCAYGILFYCTELATVNLIEAAAPDFRFFIEINRDYSVKED